MVRNQVYYTEDQDREIRLMVAMGYGTLSELFREGLDEVIKKKIIKKPRNFNALKDFAGLLKNGPNDLSKNIDYYLYEEPYQNK